MLVDQYLLAGRDQRAATLADGRSRSPHRLFEAVDELLLRVAAFEMLPDIAPRRFPALDGIKSVVRVVEIHRGERTFCGYQPPETF